LEEIGRGGMSIVYRARQRSLDREVALKVLPPAFAADPARLARFRREATVAAGLRDSRILPVFDVLEAEGVPILVLPYVAGCDLGLARLGHEVSVTAPGSELGTPGFMSPEQWHGSEDVDSRADVFGLGVMLYQALTLEWPYGKDRITTKALPPIPIHQRQPLLS